ncbi:MAG TPA: alpha-amylase family glycosyl hydrolase [Acidobacteriaceae bacterium]|nr:alpha-amylase family glycosyl hydrolase [Acidobacteriaceae bacterium]
MNQISLPRALRHLFLCCLLICAGLPLAAAPTRQRHAPPSQGKPAVQQVEPPNWWSNLPNPMVLLYGKNLTNARITSSVAGISVRRMQISQNGHWAFVWLDTSDAPPQKFDLVVRTSTGQVAVPYQLDKLHDPSQGYQGFNSADVMYLIMPDRFSQGNTTPLQLPKASAAVDRSNPHDYHGGDLRGIENHLDYLKQLGITTLWITPLYAPDPQSEDYDGYEPVNMYQINPHYGTLQDYEDLAAAVHSHGMKLVLDIVANQVGPTSVWVNDPPAPEWFHGTPANHLAATDNFASIASPHAPPAVYQPVANGWFRDILPDLNQSNPLVKQYLIQNAVWWVEKGTLDGLRLDTFPYVDRSYWQDFHSVLHALYPNLTTVGEVFNADPTVTSYFAGGQKQVGIDTGVSTLFDFPSYYALRATLTGSPFTASSMAALENIQRQDWLYPHPDQLVTFFGDHDTARFLSVAGATPARERLAFGLLATMRGLPQIYYGDEIGLSSGPNGDNRADFPGGFPGDAKNAFTPAGRTPQQQAMYAWVQGLLDLRAHHEALQTGSQQNLLADDSALVFARFVVPPQKNGSTPPPSEIDLVLMNKSDSPRTFHLDFTRTALDGVNSLAPLWNTDATVTVTQDHCDITVAAQQLVVFAAHS